MDSYLRNGPIVPDVTMVRERVGNIPQYLATLSDRATERYVFDMFVVVLSSPPHPRALAHFVPFRAFS